LSFFRKLYVQVLIAVALAMALGMAAPSLAIQMKPLGDAFISLLRMMLAPIIFCTVVTGTAHVRDMRQLGRLAAKSLIYYEVLTTLALVLGFAAVNIFKPGVGLHATQLATTAAVVQASEVGSQFSIVGYLLDIIPHTMVDAFAKGSILQVLFISLLVGAALSVGAERNSGLLKGIEEAQSVLFRIMGFLMRLAPIGAFGAVAAAIGAYGGDTLIYLAKLVLLFFATSALFVFVVLGAVAAMAKLSLFKLMKLVRDEAAILLGTASAETVIPRLIYKFEEAGCDRAVVGFVVPSAYSFNLDGTALYMAIAVGFIAQATDTPFSLMEQIGVLGVMMLTSKGGTMMAGGAFVKLAGTLQATRALPLNGLGLLFAIDRFMATCISLTNLYSNTVATFFIAKWEGGFDQAKFDAYLASERVPAAGAAEIAAPESLSN
jgi:aerobic C4-dicarboxylate transport protein